jgi:hypothetical protein
VNNDDQMKKYMTDIYPKELILVPDDTNGLSVPFLDLFLVVTNGIISTSIYDKRDVFDFPIVNYPTLTGNIPLRSSYGIFIGEAVRYARACSYYEDFKIRVSMLVKKLLKQFYTERLLKITWKKFLDSHILLIQKYSSEILTLHRVW